MMSLGSSTTQMSVGSRRGSSHTLQIGPTARLKQTSHSPTVSLTSRIASARASASSLERRRMWKGSRWAVALPPRGGEGECVLLGEAQDVEGEPLRRALTDARQARQLGDQAVDGRGEHGTADI